MADRNDDLHRSGLAFGWIEETKPRSMARLYWTGVLCLLAGILLAIAVIAWEFR